MQSAGRKHGIYAVVLVMPDLVGPPGDVCCQESGALVPLLIDLGCGDQAQKLAEERAQLPRH